MARIDMARHEARTQLRLPLELHEKLTEQARINERSLNGEIVFLLRNLMGMASMDWDDPGFALSVRNLRAALSPTMPPERRQRRRADPALLRQLAAAMEEGPGVAAGSAGPDTGNGAADTTGIGCHHQSTHNGGILVVPPRP